MAASLDQRADTSVDRAVDLMRSVMRHARSGDENDWDTLRLSRAQLKILFLLSREGPLPVHVLATRLGVTMPSITTTVDRLVQEKLVDRRNDSVDRRRVINTLTAEGNALIERLQQGRRALMQS